MPNAVSSRLVLAAVLTATLTSSGVAYSGERESCGAAAEEAQALRDDGKLLEAKEQLLRCSSATCPTAIQRDCSRWLDTVDARTPSIVLTARDAEGRDLADAKVSVDGVERPTALDGAPVFLNPGKHTLRFARPGEAPIEQTLVIRDGEKNRLVTVRFGKEPAAAVRPVAPAVQPPPAPRKSSMLDAYVIGGVGVVGIAGFGVFTLLGNSDVRDLRSSCSPRCDPADVDHARDKFMVANIALGAGVASLAVAAWLIITRTMTSPTTGSP